MRVLEATKGFLERIQHNNIHNNICIYIYPWSSILLADRASRCPGLSWFTFLISDWPGWEPVNPSVWQPLMKTDGSSCQTAKDQDSGTLICFVGNVWYQLGNSGSSSLHYHHHSTPTLHTCPRWRCQNEEIQFDIPSRLGQVYIILIFSSVPAVSWY